MGMNDINSLSHSKWNCKYHVVFAMVFSITHLTVVMYENGKYPIPYDVAPKLSDVLKIESFLLYDDFSRFLATPYTEALKSVR